MNQVQGILDRLKKIEGDVAALAENQTATKWHTPADVAKILRVSSSTIYNLVERGLLRCHRIGVGRGAIRVNDEQLREYLKSTEVKQVASSVLELRHIRLPS